MTDNHVLSSQQAEIIVKMRNGWKLERVHDEFPFTWRLFPPSGKGGLYFPSSPIRSLSDHGIIGPNPNGNGEVVLL